MASSRRFGALLHFVWVRGGGPSVRIRLRPRNPQAIADVRAAHVPASGPEVSAAEPPGGLIGRQPPPPLPLRLMKTQVRGPSQEKWRNPPGALSADNPLPLFRSSRRDAPRSEFAPAVPCHGRRCGAVADGTVSRTQIRVCGRRDLAVTEDLHEPKDGPRRSRTHTKCRSLPFMQMGAPAYTIRRSLALEMYIM